MSARTLRVLAAAARLQLAESRRSPSHLLILVTSPLFAAMFLSIARSADDDRALLSVVFAPALIALWFLALDLGGSAIATERWLGTLEGLISSPAHLGAVVLGRILSVVLIAALTFVESYAVARYGFGADVQIPHLGLLVATIAVSLLAMACTATLLAGLFVLSRNVQLFKNSMTYPFYLLGGVVVPVAMLPLWVQPLSRVFFLSWSSDLVRASLTPEAVTGWAWRLAVVAALGLVALAVSTTFIRRVVERTRRTGTAAFA